jgi:hypothetical protein
MQSLAPPERGLPHIEEFRRFERKFVVDPGRTELVAAWLRHACRPAADFPASRVTSCYYDTVDWDSYFESVDGDFAKRKVRLRWYDQLPASGMATAFLEAKEKEGFETWKRRVALSLDATLLRAGQFDRALPPAALAPALAAVGVFEARDLRPSVLVSYQRRRFVEPFSGLQLALDAGIEAVSVRSVRDWPSVRLPASVIEIKGRVLELPPPLRGLRRFVSTWSSHSKYSLAVEALVVGIGPVHL